MTTSVKRDEFFFTSFVRKRQRIAETTATYDDEYDSSILSRETCVTQGIDVVFTYVDGSDPRHINERVMHHHDAPNQQKRFRGVFVGNATLLEFALKSVVKNLVDLRRIYVVVAYESQIPQFLTSTPLNADVRVVYHKDVLHETDLPTYNSCAIENALHKIPNLSECFISMNDDVLLLKRTTFDEFWPENEREPFVFFQTSRAPRVGRDAWTRKIAWNVRIMHSKLKVPLEETFMVGHVGHFFIKRALHRLLEASEIAESSRATRGFATRTVDSLW